jgi:uncharacterized protein (TIGR03437 family)
MSRLARTFPFLFLCACETLFAQVPTVSGVLNAGDYTNVMAMGSIVAIFGTNLAPRQVSAPGYSLPAMLAGSLVEIVDGSRVIDAPLYFVSSGQINAQLPFGLQNNTVQVRVRATAGVSNAVPVTVSAVAPRLFTKSMDGKGEAILLHSDNVTLVSAAQPAQPGEVVVAYMTGLGAVSPAIQAGAAAGDGSAAYPLNVVAQPVEVLVDGTSATVLWAGMVPYFAGLYQVNFRMPRPLRDGKATIAIAAAAGQSQDNVTAAATSGIAWQPVVSASVGAAGGTVTGPGVSIAIPAGVLVDTGAITVTRSTDQAHPNPNRISDLFAVDGIPSERSVPVTITMDLPSAGGPVDEPELVMVLPYGTPNTAPTFLHTTRNGNQLTFTLPASSTTASGTGSAHAVGTAAPGTSSAYAVSAAAGGIPITRYFYYEVVNGLKYWKSSDNITVLYCKNAVTLSRAQAIADGLDKAFSLLENPVGMSWAGKPLPVEAFIYPFETFLYFWGDNPDNPGGEGSRSFGIAGQSLNLNSKFLKTDGDIPAMQILAGHELFHVLQNVYDPRAGARQSMEQTQWLWMEEATATWFEHLYEPTWISDMVIAGQWAFMTQHPLEYLGDTLSTQRHGYGASMFIEYLTSKYGPAFVSKIFSKLKVSTVATQPYPTEALRSVLTTTLSSEWLGFCGQFMAGKVYANYVVPDPIALLANVSSTSSFTDDTPKAVTLGGDFGDLTGQFYSVKFSGTWKANTALTVTLSSPGNAQAVIYLMKGKTWELKQIVDSAKWQIPNAEQLAAAKEQWVIMIANGNSTLTGTGSTHIELKLEIQESGLVYSYRESFHGLLYNQYYELDFDVAVDGTAPFKVNEARVYTGAGGCCFSVFSAGLITPVFDLKADAKEPGKDQVDEFTVTVTYSNLKRGPGAPSGWIDGITVKAGFDVASTMVPGLSTMSKTYKVTRGGKAVLSTFLTQLLWPGGGTLGGTDSPVTITFSPSK